MKNVVYIQYTDALLASTHQSAEVAAVLRNKWLSSTSPLASGMSSAFQGLVNYKAFIRTSQLGAQLPRNVVFVDAKATLRGSPLLVAKDGSGGTLYIAASTPHLMLRAVSTDGTLDFLTWNTEVPVTPPHAAEIYAG